MPPRRPGRSISLASAKLAAADPEVSVFINCPFDDEYKPLLEALVFTAVCCGFHPRTADEQSLADVPRMDRIVHTIFTSCYSIHDLSRYRGEGEDLLARFNMPLELGMVVSRQFVSDVLEGHVEKVGVDKKGEHDKLMSVLAELARQHRWLVLVPDEHNAKRFVSDLGGYDLMDYDGKVESIVPCAMSWFMAMQAGLGGLRPTKVLEGLAEFRAEKANLENEWAGRVPWSKVLEAATRCAPKP